MSDEPVAGTPGAQAVRSLGERLVDRIGRLSPERRDLAVYGASAVFAGVSALIMSIPLYRQWGQLAFGPYLGATAIAGLAAWRVAVGRRRGVADAAHRWRWARVLAFLVALLGATVVPLALEVVWTSQGNPALHVQPEVVVVEQAGARAAQGKDPYQQVDQDGRIVLHRTGEPTYELYYPYLPGMVIFGFESDFSKVSPRLRDARIEFLLFTALVAVVALSRIRPRGDPVYRALQALTVLPTAALPLATGGDDMPVAALMLLGLVALQRRRPVLAGLALGAASSLKFTSWGLVLLAAFAAVDLAGRRAIGRYAAGVAAVVVPVVLPVALRNPSAFVDNVVKFPLGLAGVASPAASALPGHLLVAALPGIHRPYVVAVGVVGLAVLVTYLRRHPPRDAADVAAVTGWVMVVAIVLAPATRVGYLLYPINLFVWAWMFRRAQDPPPGTGRTWSLPFRGHRAPPEGEAVPHGEAALQGEALPHGEAVPPGEAVPHGQSLSETSKTSSV